ncbi:MAG: DUF502 domain-containing protein [candidate division Zixibacteria bacterium]|nr:DUF502 domain-containing protein [candidate division Zixibacteria bacterium]
MSVFKLIKDIIRRQFVSGVLVVVPLILTYVVLRFLFESIDGILQPIVQRTLGYHVPGLGIAITVLIIILAGFFTRGFIGDRLFRYGDRLLTRTPIIRVFYLAAKQLIEAITIPQTKSFKQVVMFEYPRRGAYAMGFATNRFKLQQGDGNIRRLVGVFVPSTPTPVSGLVIFVPENDVIPLDISVEEAIKLIVSGAIVAPPLIRTVENRVTEEEEEHNASC